MSRTATYCTGTIYVLIYKFRLNILLESSGNSKTSSSLRHTQKRFSGTLLLANITTRNVFLNLVISGKHTPEYCTPFCLYMHWQLTSFSHNFQVISQMHPELISTHVCNSLVMVKHWLYVHVSFPCY